MSLFEYTKPPLWEQARSIFYRLPIELSREVYQFTLRCRAPLVILNEELQMGPYLVDEACTDVDSKSYQNALNFFILHASSINERDDAEIYVLGNDCFHIHNRAGATHFARIVERLSTVDKPVLVRSLIPYIACDKGDDGPESCPDYDGVPADSADYYPDDNRRTGLRAYRVLKPLLGIARLQQLFIRIYDQTGGRNFPKVRIIRNKIIPMLAAVIAKLKHTVSTTRLALQNTNSCFVVYIGNDVNISYLWDAPDEQDMAKWEEYTNMRARYKELNRCMQRSFYWRARHLQQDIKAPGMLQYHIDTISLLNCAPMRSEWEEMQSKRLAASQLYESMSTVSKDFSLYWGWDACFVIKLAAEPDWEEKVEALAKSPGDLHGVINDLRRSFYGPE